MTRISDLNLVQDLTGADVFPIGAPDGTTRGVTASDASKYFTAEIEPLVDDARQAADEAKASADAAAQSAASSDAIILREDLSKPGGAALIGLYQSTIKAETPFVSPEMYGATPTKSATDTASVLAAFSAARAMGVNVKLSRRYDCNSSVTLAGFVSEVFGVNQGECGVDFGAGFGFVIDNSGIAAIRRPVRLSSFTIRASGNKEGVAVDFTGARGVRYGPQFECRSITITGSDSAATSFEKAFKLYAAGESLFDFVTVSGASSKKLPVVFDLHSSKDVKVVNGSFSDFETFMDAHDDTEGVVVAFNHIIAGYRGVISRNNVGNLFTIIGNHFNTSLSAVELGDGTGNGSNHCKISDNFCIVFNVPEHAATPYIGFDICSNSNSLANNEVLLTGFTKDCTNTVLRQNTSLTRTATGNSISKPIGTQITRNVHIRSGATGNHVYGTQVTGIAFQNDIIDDSGNTSNRYWKMDADSTFVTRHINLGRTGTASVLNIAAYTTTDKNVSSGVLRFIGGSAGVANDAVAEFTFRETVTKLLRPSTGNTYTCGSSGAPWSGGFTQTAFTVTSDENYKTKPLDITDAMLDAAAEVEWCMFQYLDRVEAKGEDSARWHFGAMAQRFVEAFERNGLDAHKYAFICYDEWGGSPEVTGDDGEVIYQAVEAGSRYGIRYDQAIILKQKQIERDHKRQIDEMASRLALIEGKIKGL